MPEIQAEMGGMKIFAEIKDMPRGVDTIPFNTEFSFDGVNQANLFIVEQQIQKDGYFVGMAVKIEEQRTNGTILFKAYKNGVAIDDTVLDLYINSSYPMDNQVYLKFGTNIKYKFLKRDVISIKMTTSGFAPLIGNGYLHALFQSKPF